MSPLPLAVPVARVFHRLMGDSSVILVANVRTCSVTDCPLWDASKSARHWAPPDTSFTERMPEPTAGTPKTFSTSRYMKTAIIERLTGERAAGWYTGRDSPNTHRLVADYGGFAYDSDYYGDDLPFWMKVKKTDGSVVPQLIVPYTLDCNDMRFALPQGYSHADPFFQYMKDTFDALYAEGDPAGDNAPKMMSIGMHCRLLGRPGRITALQRFLDHIAQHDQVWVARRIDIARHWAQHHPAPAL